MITRNARTCEYADPIDVGVSNVYQCMKTGQECYGGCEEEEEEEKCEAAVWHIVSGRTFLVGLSNSANVTFAQRKQSTLRDLREVSGALLL